VEPFTSDDGGRLACAKCGSQDSFLDEIYLPGGIKTFMCSDTEYCQRQLEQNKSTEQSREAVTQ